MIAGSHGPILFKFKITIFTLWDWVKLAQITYKTKALKSFQLGKWAHSVGWYDTGDLEYHLSTFFPTVSFQKDGQIIKTPEFSNFSTPFKYKISLVWPFFKKNGPTPASFLVFSNKRYNFYNKSLWKNVHPVYGAGIRTHNLSQMSHHLITTRPALPPCLTLFSQPLCIPFQH